MSRAGIEKSKKRTSDVHRRAVLGGVLGAIASPAIVKAATRRPNVVLVISDDQSKQTIPLGMRKARARADLRWYENACATGLVCAAARTSIYTGQYDFHHGITHNLLAGEFDYSNWLLSWAKDAGYVTGLYGKMINDYPNGKTFRTCVPACADWWEVYFGARQHMYNYTLVEKRGPYAPEPLTNYYSLNPENYSTDLFKARACNFINRYAGQSPFFLVVCPYAPHNGSYPPPRYANTFLNLDMEPLRPPSFNVVGSKQPLWLKAEPEQDPMEMDESRREQLRTSLPLDDMVVGILNTLGVAAQLDNTLFIFTTDQSVATGEHRLTGKHHPYGSTTDIPLAIRWPGGAGGTSTQLVTHIDLTATICAMAGLTSTTLLDGFDIRANARADALLRWGGGDNGGENWTSDFVPGFSALRTNSFKYVRIHGTGFEELYALPGPEIDNLSSDPAYSAVKSAMAARLTQLLA